MGRFLPDKGAEIVFGKSADIVDAPATACRAASRAPVDGGYMIKGHWSYGSGIHHAEWIHSGCFVMDGDKMRMNRTARPISCCAIIRATRSC